MEQVIWGFNSQSDQPQLTQKYNDAFFATLHEHYKTSTYSLFKTYIKVLMPRRGEITNEMIDKLRAYLVAKPQANVSNNTQLNGNKQAISRSSSSAEAPVAENDKAFHKLVKECIELLERQ